MTAAKGKSKREKQSGSQARSSGRVSTRWINPTFNDQDVRWLTDNADNALGVCAEFYTAMPEGYSIVSKYNFHEDRWHGQCFCNSADDPNENVAVSVRGATRLDALYALAYAILHKLPPEWEGAVSDSNARWG